MADKESKGTGIQFYSMHPGWTDTPGVQTAMPGFYRSEASTMRTVDQGADTIIWLAISQDIPSDGNGCFFFGTVLSPLSSESQMPKRSGTPSLFLAASNLCFP
jgi:NAD(P)-dependent dehydrogenase (short-subunit alcohol dehydrogenase family)